ncbi:MAG TPA: hypothetical protein VK102_11855 [Sphingobacterium sp.]|nr:hypothetical protein [Sphingobacterium sp.]
MVGPSIIFYVIFALPFLYAIYWILKQEKNKSKYIWGMIIFVILVIAGVIFSFKGSRMAIQNYKQRQEDARRIEREELSIPSTDTIDSLEGDEK